MAKLRVQSPQSDLTTPSCALPDREPHDPRPALMQPIGPAMVYRLMTGEHSDARLKGWVAVAQDDPPVDVAWQVHRDRLIEQAAAHDFQPFALTKQKPSGEGFDRWEAEFMRLYRY
jgi:hypothetical protein